MKPSACANWAGAAPSCCSKACSSLRDLEICSRLGIWHAVHCDEQIDWLAAHKTQVGHRVFLKMNSGMNRLGFTPERFRAAYARLNALPQVDEISFMTHFSDADVAHGIDHQAQGLSRNHAGPARRAQYQQQRRHLAVWR